MRSPSLFTLFHVAHDFRGWAFESRVVAPCIIVPCSDRIIRIFIVSILVICAELLGGRYNDTTESRGSSHMSKALSTCYFRPDNSRETQKTRTRFFFFGFKKERQEQHGQEQEGPA